MEMAEEVRIRESRGNRRVVPDGGNGKPDIKVLTLPLSTACYAAETVGGIHLNRQRAAPVSQQDLTYKIDAVSGDIPGKIREQRRKELDNVVEEGMLAVSMNVAPFEKTAGISHSINWMMEDPPDQGKLVHVKITRDDIGGKIFKIGTTRSRNYPELNPLFTPLLAGEYGYTAVFLACQEETEVPIGQAVIKIKLVLQERREGNAYKQEQETES